MSGVGRRDAVLGGWSLVTPKSPRKQGGGWSLRPSEAPGRAGDFYILCWMERRLNGSICNFKSSGRTTSDPHLLFSFLNTNGQITPSVLGSQSCVQGASGLQSLGLLWPYGCSWKLCLRTPPVSAHVPNSGCRDYMGGCLACERRRRHAWGLVGGWGPQETSVILFPFGSLLVR